MKKKRTFLKNKKGSSLVYVIVAASLIIILGAATTSLAYANLKATQVQTQSDNNFYSADSIMNAIVGGLTEKISQTYTAEYSQVLTTMVAKPEETHANEEFKERFLSAMKEELIDATMSVDGGTVYYNLEKLYEYVESTSSFQDNIQYTITAINGGNYMDSTEKGLILRNLHITYQNDNGYYDEITTDVKIIPPTPNFELIPYQPFNAGALISDHGIEVETGIDAKIKGDVYAGALLNGPGSSDIALNIKDGSSAEFDVDNEIVFAGGKVVLDRNTTLNVGNQTDDQLSDIYMENIEVLRNANLILRGSTKVLDDLEVNGSNATVQLIGTYCGYGQPHVGCELTNVYHDIEAHNKNSAININGANTTLDLSEIDNLLLAGSSYIKSSSVVGYTGHENNAQDVQTGEAFSVKSNQIAYLINEKAFVNPIKNFVSNPMSEAQFNALTSDTKWKQNILNGELTIGGTYGGTFNADINAIYSQIPSNTVYLYLQFSSAEDAARYFNAVMESDSLTAQQVRTYAEQYISKFTINSNAKLLTNSNFIRTTINNTDPNYDDLVNNAQTEYNNHNIQQVIPVDANGHTNGLGYSSTDSASSVALDICKAYFGDGTPGSAKRNANQFSTYINESALKNVVTAYANAEFDQNTNENGQSISINGHACGFKIQSTTDDALYIIDNEGVGPFVLDQPGSGLIIATGDVHIKSDWVGSLIIKGKTVLNPSDVSNVQVTYSSFSVSNSMALYFKVKQADGKYKLYSPINAFNGYENYEPNRATQDEGDETNNLRNCITFTNWNKQ